MAAPVSTDVLVVGAGPAGSAAAAWAARAGRDVVLADAAAFPRDKPCGDGLTPRAIAELDRLGLGDWVRAHGINRGLRATGFGVVLTLPWPGGSLPDHGGAVPRTGAGRADPRGRAEGRGRGVRRGAGRGRRTGRRARHRRRVRRRPHRAVPQADRRRRRAVDARPGAGPRVAPRHGLRGGRPRLHQVRPQRRRVDLLAPRAARRGRRGARRVRVGVPALATARSTSASAPSPPQPARRRSGCAASSQHYADARREDWQLDGPVRLPASALLPMGGAVSHVAGHNWALIGDAAGCVNPLNGEGIDYGLETGRLVAELLADERHLGVGWPAVAAPPLRRGVLDRAAARGPAHPAAAAAGRRAGGDAVATR